jgi:hypothetical protein
MRDVQKQLGTFGNSNPRVYGHTYMTKDMKREPIVETWSHKMIPTHVYDTPFTIRFQERSE